MEIVSIAGVYLRCHVNNVGKKNVRNIITQTNFDHLLVSTTSIYFIPSKFDLWYKMYGSGPV